MIINDVHYRAVWFEDNAVKMIDQRIIPHEFRIVEYRDYRDVADAISVMVVRGAPAIGAAGAWGMALASVQGEDIDKAAEVLANTRPTAQDLFTSIEKVKSAVFNGESAVKAAQKIEDEYVDACRKIGEYGNTLIESGMKINTHCNAGWLATVDWGTALAPIYTAKRANKEVFVFTDETRPRCQGSRLTAFELAEEGIPHAVIADNAAGFFMSRKEIDMVIVGSDRIAINGDIANKIGTYTSALAAKANNIPFYVAAPLATIDRNCASGDLIPIEERGDEEVSSAFGYSEEKSEMLRVRLTPANSPVRNPAFDVTPAELITGIITENGIFKPENISEALK